MTANESPWWLSENDQQYARRRPSMARQVLGLLGLSFGAGAAALIALGGAAYVLFRIGGKEALLPAGIGVAAVVLTGGALALGLVYVNSLSCGSPYDQIPKSERLARQIQTRDRVLLRTEVEGPANATRTIVFAHGICNDMRAWHFQRAAIPADCRAVFYDARGHGRSGNGKLDNNVPGLRVLADDLATVIDKCAPTRELVLVGHSMGGMTIFALAAIRPDIFARVRGVLILDATPGPAKDAVWFGLSWIFRPVVWLIQKYAAAVARLSGLLPAFTLRILGMGPYLLAMRWLAVAGNDSVDLTARRLTARMVYESNPRRYASHIAGIFEHDERPHLRRLAPIPTTIIAGEKDRLVRPSSYDGWLHALPEARFVSVPDSGHMTMLVRADLVNRELELLVDRGRPAAIPADTAPAEQAPAALALPLPVSSAVRWMYRQIVSTP
ncbi:alpha/beta fold hydrolase [Smaragdicoccus niigatensis]|uniref:alpha/beta fold hydrolase n=1 Tax=Smaragdicoccus niigatensis TaxID=359359 RepID=UPI00037DE327|nr:alpha/beta hydrolase [Smaragdicoccus niigatensis]